MRRLVILNPTARRASRHRGLLEEMAAEPETELRETTGPGDASALARRARAEGAAELVSAGGDGTLNEVVNGLAPFGREGDGTGSVPAVGLLPLGTGNDTARSLGVPLDPEEARAVLDEGATRTVDVGRVRGSRERHFVNSAVAGVGGLVERRLPAGLKRWLGSYSYRVAAVAALRHIPRYRVTAECDEGRETVRSVAYSVIVANGSHAGGGVPVAPGARVDDGLLDLVVVECGPARKMPGLVWSVLRGEHPGRDDVRRERVESVSIRARPPIWVSLDGEVLGDEAFRADVVPDALRVLTPRIDERNGDRRDREE